MTLIEFYEKDAIENICSCFVTPPERVILVGHKNKELSDHAKRYEAFFAARGQQIEFKPRSVNKNNIEDIVQTLNHLVENYDDCVFDLTGGGDLYLVAVGIVFATHPDKNIQMHRINLHNNAIYDCDLDGQQVLRGPVPPISVEDDIRIYGGDIVYEEQRSDTTFRWPQDEEFLDDIDRIWKICRKHGSAWNTTMGILIMAEDVCKERPDPLTTVVKGVYAPTGRSEEIFGGLKKAGILREFKLEDGVLTVRYKNEFVKRCLMKEGQALEMKIWCAAIRAREKDGTRTYNDVVNGVNIDWDGDIHGVFDSGTENEIDVLMMHGMIPVFVSCKNGDVDKDEVYKLNAVAEKFGGKYAKKVLVTTALRGKSAESMVQRGVDMGIRVETNLHNVDDDELVRIVKSFWCND